MKKLISACVATILFAAVFCIGATAAEPQYTTVSAGEVRSMFITEKGDLYLLGNDAYELFFEGGVRYLSPKKIMENTVSVSTGTYHNMAITENGDLYAWGNNLSGQLGDGTYVNNNTPHKIMNDVVAACTGSAFSMALTKDGALYTWGSNYYGQLGDGGAVKKSAVPKKIMEGVKSISACADQAMAVTDAGDLYTWGNNLSGQSEDHLNVYTPLKIMTNVSLISTGYHNGMAVTTDGSLYVWGCNFHSSIGDGTMTVSSSPTKVMDHVIAASAGYDHCMALTENHDLYAWGLGPNGDGTETSFSEPKKIMSDIIAISAGYCFDFAVSSRGTIYSWGYNKFGQLGDGTTETRYSPVTVRLPDKLRLISAEKPSSWADDAINSAKENNLIPDELNSYYQSPITRRDFCLLVKQVLNSTLYIGDTPYNKTNPDAHFTDTNHEGVLFAAQFGIVNGYQDGTFRPDNPITRQEAAVMLYRMDALLRREALTFPASPFHDIDEWAVPAVNYVVSEGIMNGTGNGFDPNGIYTREQAIVTIERLYASDLY